MYVCARKHAVGSLTWYGSWPTMTTRMSFKGHSLDHEYTSATREAVRHESQPQ